MANPKFLPFITEKSSPVHIFDTLLSRSKGMSRGALASIFHIIMYHGIDAVRAKAKEMTDLTVSQVYIELIAYYSAQQIEVSDIDVFLSIGDLLTDKKQWHTDLDKFPTNDIMVFCLVMAKLDQLTVYTNLPFKELLKYRTYLNDLKTHIKLSDTGTIMKFNKIQDVKAFILYQMIFIGKREEKLCIQLANKPAETGVPSNG